MIITYRELQRMTVKELLLRLPVIVTVNGREVMTVNGIGATINNATDKDREVLITKDLQEETILCDMPFCKKFRIGKYSLDIPDPAEGMIHVQKNLCGDHLKKARSEAEHVRYI